MDGGESHRGFRRRQGDPHGPDHGLRATAAPCAKRRAAAVGLLLVANGQAAGFWRNERERAARVCEQETDDKGK